MAEVVEQRSTDNADDEVVIVHDRDDAPARRSNVGIILAVILLIVLLFLLLFGRGIFGGRTTGNGNDINITPPTTTPTTPTN